MADVIHKLIENGMMRPIEKEQKKAHIAIANYLQ